MPITRRILLVAGIVAILIAASFATLEVYQTYGPTKVDFRVGVGYQGPWQVSWTSYRGGPPAVIGTGSYTGTGNNSRPVSIQMSLSDYNNYGAYLCAQATKLDNSSSTLTLSLYASGDAGPVEMHNTSAPSGSTTVCGGLIP